MSDQSDNLVNLLLPFGITKEEAKIYLLLLKKSELTALQISREIHLARTKVYRLLDKLNQKGLVGEKLSDYGKKFIAHSYHQLDLLIAQKEHEAKMLSETKGVIYDELDRLVGKQQSPSKVLYYSGLEGLKQITWNSLKAQKELCLFEIESMSAFLDYGFYERVRREFVDRKVYVRELTNEKNMAPWTKVKEFVRQYWQCRYIDPQELEMKFELLIYNEVYVMYNYRGGDIFGVEIYDHSLAAMQRQLFDFMWLNARKIKIINDGGATKLK
ncbi:hypothetical protein HY345_02810 [Candidatus Microgenomates bacterium]|nr:hypothetical protein [Candidatus Microgenomates bacterium]